MHYQKTAEYQDLALSANLLECYILDSDNGLFALADVYTANQITPFYTLQEWQNLNVAKVMIDYLKNK